MAANQIIIIILLALLVCFVSFTIILLIQRNKTRKIVLANYREQTERKLRISNNELNRYKTLYENLQANIDSINKPINNTSSFVNNSSEDIKNELILERNRIEIEKAEIAKRNHKLWDMSLAIQKEKERIDYLKDDLEQKHKAVIDSIRYAQYIQIAVLPTVEILKESFSDYFLLWKPLNIVSGDFYWHKRQGNYIVFAIADCTGHGVPGAFMSLLGITFLNDICVNITDQTMPHEILENLRTRVIEAMTRNIDGREMNDGMDIALCIYNKQTNKAFFSGANNPMFHVRGDVLTEYKPIRNPIGKFTTYKKFESNEINLQKGDWIYMFSDGYADQFGSINDRKLMKNKFRSMISTLAIGNTDGNTQKDFLNEFLLAWQGDVQQMDDILIGGYRI